MTLTALGINHQRTPIAIREQGVILQADYAQHLNALQALGCVQEALLLSTCNRTELYCTTKEIAPVQAWFTKLFQAENDEALSPYLYTYQEASVIKHAMRLAMGLDSMVLGEQQILGQLKQAYRTASDLGTLGSRLHPLFQYVFSATKQIRHVTTIGAYPISLAFVAVNLAKKIFSDLTQTQVILVGSGQTTELVGHYLRDKGVCAISVFSRSFSSAQRLAQTLQGQAHTLSALPDYLPRADIVICATSSALPVLGKGMVEKAIKVRKHRPMLMIDLASPRDIESQVRSLEDVYLYDLDDLQAVIKESLDKRFDAAKEADALIDAHVMYYQKRLERLKAGDLIKQFRAQQAEFVDITLEKALHRLARGEPGAEVLAEFAACLNHKFSHHPSVFMQEAAENGDLQALELCRQVFALVCPLKD
jgi:glutamyl-tRNA reductase